jgi:hypothetical protein
MAGIWRRVLPLVLLLALPQVQAATWTVWSCEGSFSSTQSAPAFEAGCCQYERDHDGTFMTDASRCGSRALH